MGQLAAVAEEAGQLQSDLQHKAGIIAAQVRAPPHRLLHHVAGWLGLHHYRITGILPEWDVSEKHQPWRPGWLGRPECSLSQHLTLCSFNALNELQIAMHTTLGHTSMPGHSRMHAWTGFKTCVVQARHAQALDGALAQQQEALAAAQVITHSSHFVTTSKLCDVVRDCSMHAPLLHAHVRCLSDKDDTRNRLWHQSNPMLTRTDCWCHD